MSKEIAYFMHYLTAAYKRWEIFAWTVTTDFYKELN